MKKLRKRRIAKQHDVTYKRQANKNGDFHYFHKKNMGYGFYFCNDATFLNVVNNKDKWGDLDFERRA